MKIIGTTNDGYIIDCKNNEIARLIGYFSEYHMREGKHLVIGDEINISKMYEQLYRLADDKRRIEAIKDTLQSAAENLDTVIPIIDNVIEAE